MKVQIFLLSAASISTLVAQPTQLAVSVADASGSSVAGASVTISSRPVYNAAGPASTNANYSAKTGPAGIATFNNIPSGAYAVCAYPVAGQVVDTCSWAAREPSIFVKPGQTASVTAAFRKGAVLTVVLNDSLKLLQTVSVSPSTGYPRQIRLDVAAINGHVQPMHLDQTLATGRQYSLVVPTDLDLKLIVGSFGYRFAQVNKSVSTGKGPSSAIPVRIPSSGPGQTIQLSLLSLL